LRVRPRALGVALAILLSLLLPAAGHSATTVASHFRLAIDRAAASADFSRTPARSRYVILQGWQAPLARRLKAANPGLRVLVYKNLSFMTERDAAGRSSTGVATQDAQAHPEWYLRDAAGRPVVSRRYDWLAAADVGDPGYQVRWADNVLAEVRREGWDGVMADDANPTMEWHFDHADVLRYPTPAAWQQATGAALAAIGARFRSAGRLVFGNFGFWKSYPAVVSGWLRHVDGGLEEWFVKTGTTGARDSYIGGRLWEIGLQQVKDTEAQGKAFLGITHSANGDAAAARYGWATLLLAAGGRSSFALHEDYANENWFPEYEYDLGEPLEAESAEPTGVHRRRFANGLVLVNPSSASARVSFGGVYSGSGLPRSSGAEMSPRSALVLRRNGGRRPARRARAAL